MIEKGDDRRTKAIDSLMNFETVKYFNTEEYEMKRYIEGISKYQKSNKKVSFSTLCLNFGQNLINIVGQLIGCLLAASLVANQDKTIGKNIFPHVIIQKHKTSIVLQVIMFYVQHTSYKSWDQFSK